MALYCFYCRRCGQSATSTTRASAPCVSCGYGLTRDYRAESVGVQVVGLRRERERGGSSAVRDLFLPTAKELAGPGDPDGAKAIRKWNDEHDPKPGNKKPLRPESPRSVW